MARVSLLFFYALILSIFSFSDSQTDPLSIFGVTPSSVNKWWMESVNIVVFAQKCKALIKYATTFSDGNVSAFISLEVLLEFLKLRIAILDSDDTLFSEDDGLGPLSKKRVYLFFFGEFGSKLATIELIVGFHDYEFVLKTM